MASCAINGAKTSAHGFIIDDGMQSIGKCLPDIEFINFNASSTVGGFRKLKKSPLAATNEDYEPGHEHQQ